MATATWCFTAGYCPSDVRAQTSAGDNVLTPLKTCYPDQFLPLFHSHIPFLSFFLSRGFTYFVYTDEIKEFSVAIKKITSKFMPRISVTTLSTLEYSSSYSNSKTSLGLTIVCEPRVSSMNIYVLPIRSFSAVSLFINRTTIFYHTFHTAVSTPGDEFVLCKNMSISRISSGFCCQINREKTDWRRPCLLNIHPNRCAFDQLPKCLTAGSIVN